MNHQNGQLDSSVEIVTPENIAFEYRAAGPFRRLPAYLIDLLIRLVAIFVAAMGLGLGFAMIGLPGLGGGAMFVFLFVITWFYGPLFEVYWNGQTPGKRITGLRVLTVEGQPINGLQAVMRNLLRAVDAFPFWLYLVGLIASMSNRRYQRLGDLVCRTVVVVEEQSWYAGMVRIAEPEAIRLAAQLPPNYRPSRSLAKALAAYVQRRYYLPWPRRLEIARHVGEPLRERFGLPPETNLDLLLCAVYHRTFVTERAEQPQNGQPNPFVQPPVPAYQAEIVPAAAMADPAWASPPAPPGYYRAY